MRRVATKHPLLSYVLLSMSTIMKTLQLHCHMYLPVAYSAAHAEEPFFTDPVEQKKNDIQSIAHRQ